MLPSNSEDELLRDFIERSLTSAEMDTRCRCKNAKALWLGVKESERLTGLPSSSSSDGGTTTDDDTHPATDAYTDKYYHRFGDSKGKSPPRQW